MTPQAEQFVVPHLKPGKLDDFVFFKEELCGLDERQREVLALRAGLVDGRSYTLGEIGAKLGVTRERARQIQSAALVKCRRHRARRRQ